MNQPENDNSIWRLFGVLLICALLVGGFVIFWHARQASADASGDARGDGKNSLAELSLLNDRAARKGTAQAAGGPEKPISDPSLREKYLLTVPDSAHQLLKLSASSALVADLDTGGAIFAKNEHQKLFPASVTKIASALVAKKTLDLNKTVTISDWAASAEPNRMGLKAGEKVPLSDLMAGMLINSGNDAARAVADAHPGGRDGFYAQMNQLVKDLGLTDTHFANSSGLHEDNHISSAFDLAVLMRYLAAAYPDLLAIMRTTDKTIPATADHPTYYLHTLSTMLQGGANLEAVKTGYTPEAGHTWIATTRQGNRHVVIVFMNSWDSTGDAQKLLDLGQR